MLIMFMDAAVWWDLNVSLSELKLLLCSYCSWSLQSGGSSMSASLNNKHLLYMLIMFMDAVVGWVLDVCLSGQQTCAIYVDNAHGR
jgi:hypothetical protein